MSRGLDRALMGSGWRWPRASHSKCWLASLSDCWPDGTGFLPSSAAAGWDRRGPGAGASERGRRIRVPDDQEASTSADHCSRERPNAHRHHDQIISRADRQPGRMFVRRRARELSASVANRRAFVGIVMVSAGTSCRAANGVVACAPALSGGNRVSGGLRSRGRDPLPAGCVADETHAVDLLPAGPAAAAARIWAGLGKPWQEAFRQAWEALRTGNIAVGTCASTPGGEIVCSGVPHLHVHLAPHHDGDAPNTNMIRGPWKSGRSPAAPPPSSAPSSPAHPVVTARHGPTE